MEEIVAVDRNHKGEIISFKTSSGRVISYRKAIMEIEAGAVSGVQVMDDGIQEIPIITQSNDSESLSFKNYPPIF